MQAETIPSVSKQDTLVGRIKSTEAWQRLVVRKHRAKFILYVIFTAGVLIWAQLVISSNEPVLKWSN